MWTTTIHVKAPYGEETLELAEEMTADYVLRPGAEDKTYDPNMSVPTASIIRDNKF